MDINGIINVSGTYTLVPDSSWQDLQTDEIRLLCDTSLAPVIVNMPSIASLNGLWNVKIFVVDKSQNAATNNITINAVGGNKIGSDTSELINVNGAAIEVQVLSSTNWLAVKSAEMGGGSSTTLLSISNRNYPLVSNANPNLVVAGIDKAYANLFLQTASNLKTISFPDLLKLYGDVNINDGYSVSVLESINFPLLNEVVGAVEVANNPLLTSVSFPKLKKTSLGANPSGSFPGTFIGLENCAAITSFSLPALTDIEGFDALSTLAFISIYNNDALQTVSFPLLENMNANLLSATISINSPADGMMNLASVDFPVLKNVALGGGSQFYFHFGGEFSPQRCNITMPELLAAPELNFDNYTPINFIANKVVVANKLFWYGGPNVGGSLSMSELTTILGDFYLYGAAVDVYNIKKLATVGGSFSSVLNGSYQPADILDLPLLTSIGALTPGSVLNISQSTKPAFYFNFPLLNSDIDYFFTQNTTLATIGLPAVTAAKSLYVSQNDVLATLSLPLLASITGTNDNLISLNPLLQVIDLHLVPSINAGFAIQSNAILTTIDFAALVSSGISGSQAITIAFNPLLTTINMPLYSNGGGVSMLDVNNNAVLTTLNLPAYTYTAFVNIAQNPLLTSINFGATVTCLSLNLQNNALSQTSVDDILNRIDLAGQSNGTLLLDGGTNSTPSVAGLVSKANLVGKGWTVTTN
jgi:hypothetical protein